MEPFVNLRSLHQTHDGVLGTDCILGRPCLRSGLLSTALLHLGHMDDWNGELRTFPDARARTYPRLTFKDSACVEIHPNHINAGQVGDTVGSSITFLCLWAYKAGVRLSAPTMSPPPEEWRANFRGRTFFAPDLRSVSVRRAVFFICELGQEFAKLSLTIHCAYLARAIEIRECVEIAISIYLLGSHPASSRFWRNAPAPVGSEAVSNRGRRILPITPGTSRDV